MACAMIHATFPLALLVVLTWTVLVLWTATCSAREAGRIDHVAAEIAGRYGAITKDGERVLRDCDTRTRCICTALECNQIRPLDSAC